MAQNIQTRINNKLLEINEYQIKYLFELRPVSGRPASGGKFSALWVKWEVSGLETETCLIAKSENPVALEGYLKGILAILQIVGV